MRFLHILFFFKIFNFFASFLIGSHILATAEKLESKLAMAFLEVKHCCKEVSYALEAQLNTHA